MSAAPRRQVPWEIANYSPLVHAQTFLALNSGPSLNETMADADWNLETRQDRDDLHDAFQRMANRFIPYLPGGSKHHPKVSDSVFGAREALHRGDLDATLHHLTAAAEHREVTRGDDPIDLSVDQVLDQAADRLRADPATAGPSTARGSGRGPAMSAMTAANHVRETVEAADREHVPLTLNDGDIEALQRVDPIEASDTATRPDWQHRRPERAPQQPDPDLPTHHR